jgi:hypothetical protein
MERLFVPVVLLAAYQWPFAPQYRTGTYDKLLIGFALILAALALGLFFAALSALIRGLKDRWRLH